MNKSIVFLTASLLLSDTSFAAGQEQINKAFMQKMFGPVCKEKGTTADFTSRINDCISVGRSDKRNKFPNQLANFKTRIEAKNRTLEERLHLQLVAAFYAFGYYGNNNPDDLFAHVDDTGERGFVERVFYHFCENELSLEYDQLQRLFDSASSEYMPNPHDLLYPKKKCEVIEDSGLELLSSSPRFVPPPPPPLISISAAPLKASPPPPPSRAVVTALTTAAAVSAASKLPVTTQTVDQEWVQNKIKELLKSSKMDNEFVALTQSEKVSIAKELEVNEINYSGLRKPLLQGLCQTFLKTYDPGRTIEGGDVSGLKKRFVFVAPKPLERANIKGNTAGFIEDLQENADAINAALNAADTNPEIVKLQDDLAALLAEIEKARKAYEAAQAARVRAENFEKRAKENEDSATAVLMSIDLDDSGLDQQQKQKIRPKIDGLFAAGQDDSKNLAKADLYKRRNSTQGNIHNKLVEIMRTRTPAEVEDAYFFSKLLAEDYLKKAAEERAQALQQLLYAQDQEAEAERILIDLIAKYDDLCVGL